MRKQTKRRYIRTQKNKRKRRAMILKLSGLGIFAVLLLIYIGGVLFYSSHFLKRSTLNEMELSGKTVKSVMKLINNYELELSERTKDGGSTTEIIKGSDIGLDFTEDALISQLMKEQNQFLWFVNREHAYTRDSLVKVDDAKLNQVISGLQAFSADFYTSPVDASMSDFVSGVGYEIVKEEQGNELKQTYTDKVIKDAVLNLDASVDLDASGCYMEPEIYADNAELNTLCSNMNQYCKTVITYQFGDTTEVLDGSTIRDWLTVDGTSVSLPEEPVSDYVAELRKKYDTIFHNRKFTTTSGTQVTVEGGDYGWWMDSDLETSELYELISQGSICDRTPEYKQTAAAYGDNDYGDSYIEINLTAQHMYCYIEGKMVLESDFVSGNTSKGNGTPAGTYGITYKQRDAMLVGENYETPVSYWMPFNGNIGLHDATWRSQFGSSFYKSSGSHGCVNLPYAKAKELYSYIEQGMAVICYELPGSSSSVTYQSAAQIAQSAIDAIDRIGTVTKDSTKIISRARQVYNELDGGERGYVKNYDVLVAAEEAIKAL